MKQLFITLIAAFSAFAADAPKPAPTPEPKHLTAIQQRDLYKLVLAATEADNALLQTPQSAKAKIASEAVQAKAQELTAVCGAQIKPDASGMFDCAAPAPAPPAPKPAPAK